MMMRGRELEGWVGAVILGGALALSGCNASADPQESTGDTGTTSAGTGETDPALVTATTTGAQSTSSNGVEGSLSSNGSEGNAAVSMGGTGRSVGATTDGSGSTSENSSVSTGGSGGSGGAGKTSTTSEETSTASSGTPTAGGAPHEEPTGVEGIIAVGYGGLRIVTRDRGETWEDETHWSENGGDDHDLLRTIAYGNGVWVTGGWRLSTSENGVDWVDHGDAEDVIAAVNCPVMDGMAFGAGMFLVACGATLAASEDGLAWRRVGPTPTVGGHPYLVYDVESAQFACSGDNGRSYLSEDGEHWNEVAVAQVRLCDGLVPEAQCPAFYAGGVYLSTEWGGLIRRSTNGSSFTTTYRDSFGNNLFTEYSFAVGRVAP